MQTVWSDFVDAPMTLGATPGVREQWHKGRPRYAVWAFRVQHPDVLKRMRQVREVLGSAIVPVTAPHVTVWVPGFPTTTPTLDDDIAWSALETQRDTLRGLHPGTVQVDGANAFLSCAMLEIRDTGWLAGLRRALAQVGPPELRFAPYNPHVTVGRFPRAMPTGPVAERLRPLRALPPLSVEVQSIELLTFDAAIWDAPLKTEWEVTL